MGRRSTQSVLFPVHRASLCQPFATRDKEKPQAPSSSLSVRYSAGEGLPGSGWSLQALPGCMTHTTGCPERSRRGQHLQDAALSGRSFRSLQHHRLSFPGGRSFLQLKKKSPAFSTTGTPCDFTNATVSGNSIPVSRKKASFTPALRARVSTAGTVFSSGKRNIAYRAVMDMVFNHANGIPFQVF